VNEAFRARKMQIQLPYPETWQVKDLQILEKKGTAMTVRVLLAVELIREGQVIRDLCYLEGDIEREREGIQAEPAAPGKRGFLLPQRNRFDFDGDADARTVVREAFASLLQDNGYRIEPHPEADLYGVLGQRGFFAALAARCDDLASRQVERLIGLRKRYRHMHDYGLVVPAFQEVLGIPLSEQESWVLAHVERLSAHRVGVFGVDNGDPNRIYPFTTYPQVRGLLRYFVATSRQWQDARSRYVSLRTERKRT